MSLIHWWPLNGNLKDYGIKNSSVTTHGTPTYSNSGKIGKAPTMGSSFYFDSPCVIATNKMSLAFWVYPNNVSQWRDIFSIGTNLGRIELTNTSTYVYYWYQTNNGGYNLADSQSIFTLGNQQWYHITMTVDGTNVKFYVNGVLQKTITQRNQLSNVIDDNLITWGRRGVTDTGGFGGMLNDVRIYDHALSVKEIKEISKGLVLHYNFEDEYIEGTTNRVNISNPSSTCYNGVTSTYGWGSNTNMQKTMGTFHGKYGMKVSSITAGSSTYPYVFFDNLNPYSTTENTYSTFSFDYYATSQTILVPYSYYSGVSIKSKLNGVDMGGATISGIKLNTWNHIEITYQRTTNDYQGSGCGYIRIGSTSHTSTTSDYWVFVNLQSEYKDHATPFVNGTRTTGKIYDSSGLGNNGTPYGNTLQIVGDSRIGNKCAKFDNTANSAIVCGNGMFVKDELTVNWWGYMSSWSSYGRAISCTEGGGWNFEPNSSKMGFPVYLSGIGYKSAVSTTTLANLSSGWHMFTGTYDGYTVKIYIDGVLEGSISSGASSKTAIGYPNNGLFIGAEAAGTATTPTSPYFNGNMADVKIYATALSQQDIILEYDRRISIDRNGNFYSDEFVEDISTSNPKMTNTDIVKAQSLSEGLLTKVLSDGSVWERIYFFDYDKANSVWNSTTAKHCDTDGKFSILGELNKYVPSDGWYEFYYRETNQWVRWKQSFNPLSRVTSGTSGISSEYTYIGGSTNPYSSFSGLTRYSNDDSNSCYLRGAPSWWCAIAPYQTSYDVFPDMWGNSTNNHHQELWIRVDNLKSGYEFSNNKAKMTSTSYMSNQFIEN